MSFLSLVLGINVHSMFSERHDTPSDFPRLLKEGAYAYCRHPFYLALMANQASIALISCSLAGLVVFAALIPFWLFLIHIEEKELLEYWGEAYKEYMDRVPALLPIRLKAFMRKKKQDN